MKVGSLFSGYGGLDLAIQSLWPDAHPAWFVEFDKHPSAILARHWPNVPNYGDITAVDWAAVEPVDILTGGFPCQDLSVAGKRAGLRPGTRSGLWAHMAYAIDQLRPALVVAENVRGLLIERWEHTIDRPAPSPTEPGRDGRPRLSPAFVEWMMGLPAGWVTDSGIPRAAQLKALGNGVVPQQAALALRMLLGGDA